MEESQSQHAGGCFETRSGHRYHLVEDTREGFLDGRKMGIEDFVDDSALRLSLVVMRG